ncbi:MAG: hypothetical protein Q9190_005733 [Brigantiaea leucoxantha]
MATTYPEFNQTTNATAVAAAFPSAIANRTFLITGVSSGGIGGATAIALATQNPKLLILSGRRPDPVSQVISLIHAQHPHVPCRWLPLDLSSTSSVRSAADSLLLDSTVPAIDVLINNAGMASPPQRTICEGTGVEIQFSTNHLGHFLLTKMLMPKLIGAAASGLSQPHNSLLNRADRSNEAATRIVNLSSNGHNYSPVRFSDLNWTKSDAELPESERPNRKFINARAMADKAEDRPSGDLEGSSKITNETENDPYIPVGGYGQSKTANMLFTLGLNRRYYSTSPTFPSSHASTHHSQVKTRQGNDIGEHVKIASFAVHPGVIRTDLFRTLGSQDQQDKMFKSLRPVNEWKSLDQGAATTLVAALDPALTNEAKGVGPMTEIEDEKGVKVGFYLSDCQLAPTCAPWGRDVRMAERLWELSEGLMSQESNVVIVSQI